MEITASILYACLLLYLSLEAYEDYKTGYISIIASVIAGMAGAGINLIFGIRNIEDLGLGLAAGAAMIFISFASSKAVGYGDGIMMLAAGAFLGWTDTVILLMISLLLAAVGSIVMMVCRIKRSKDRIAFAPFLFGGYLLLLGVYK